MDWLDPMQCACAHDMSNRLIARDQTDCACAHDMSIRPINV